MTLLKCCECECAVEPSDTIKYCSSGSLLTVSVYCTSGHLVYQWHFQLMIGKMPAGNLLISAATLFCGQTFANVDQFADCMNLNFIGKIYILHHSACVLILAVEHTCAWLVMEGVVPGQIATLQNRPRQYHPHIYQN